MRARFWKPAAAVAMVLCGLVGCARSTSGYRISNETIAFVRPGVTTRSDIVENLGQPLFELQDPHVAAYSWGKLRAATTSPVTSQSGLQPGQMSFSEGAPPSAGQIGTVEGRRWICCFALDANNRVTRLGKFEIEGATSLESAVRQWATNSQ